MLRHHHLQTLRAMLEERRNTRGALEWELQALEAALEEFRKAGSTLRDMDPNTALVERLCLEIVQQTQLHPELAPIVLNRLEDFIQAMKRTYFYNEEPTVPLTEEEKEKVKG